MANPVQRVPWKVPFDASGSGPFVIKVLLSDLLFEKSDPADPTTWVPYTSGGFRPPHDILLYDPSLFNTDGSLKPSILKNDRQKKGFFLTKVTYDDRANKTWVEDDYYKNVVNGDPSTAGYYMYDWSASLTPTDEIDYRSREKTFNIYLPPSGSEYYNDEDYYTQSCTVGVEGTSLENTAFLILGNRDEALEATLPGSALLPYTRIRANADYSVQEVYDIVRFFTGYGVGDTGERSVKTVNGDTVSAQDTLDPLKNVYLQHVEVWLRCAWFADYVDPSSYQQDLHQGSDVRHKNLILGKGDFEKYSRESADAETRPYLPLTPPREDIMTQQLIDADNLSSFPIPSKTGEYNAAGGIANNPIGWLDPDTIATNDAKSAAIPECGNVYTSGRIFSPTVDELWTYIKKLVSGRDGDNEEYSTGVPKSIAASALYNEVDTRLAAEPRLELVDDKEGDPLNADGSEFLNSGEGIVYYLNENIKYIADKIAEGIETSDFAPFEDHDDTDALISSRTRITTDAVVSNASWGLRDRPLSLRELEALNKNLQYNLEVVFNYLANNKVSTGNTDAEEDSMHGTLYQLHVGFTPDLDSRDPNSKWMSFENTELPTDDAVTYGDELPGGATYNRLSDISSQDVYLSAEGKWRYLFDHVRVPVLDETY